MYYDGGKNRSRDFDRFAHFELPEYERAGVSNSVCVLLALEWLDRLESYSLIKRLSVAGWCSVNMNIPSQKIGGLNMGHGFHKARNCLKMAKWGRNMQQLM
jgi:hypothetical protein